MKIITLSSYKGGVGKTTTSICLACLFSPLGETLLIDSDPNRSATTWARLGKLPFKVCSENAAPKLMGQSRFDFVIIDTPARPLESELQELADGCDLLILPSTPDSLSMDALALMTQSLPNRVNYRVLLTMIPPPPQKDGLDAFHALKENGFPVLDRGIRLLKAYKDAAALGQPIYKVKGGKIAWRDWMELAKLSPLAELLDSAKS
ncbi:ParA family protein [Nostoc punctiforme UO1]|uniref:ParA family protein n=1 Tax=Nostoc punctiforme TaxID=272131 RepID=UPI0030B1E338